MNFTSYFSFKALCSGTGLFKFNYSRNGHKTQHTFFNLNFLIRISFINGSPKFRKKFQANISISNDRIFNFSEFQNLKGPLFSIPNVTETISAFMDGKRSILILLRLLFSGGA